MRRTQSKQCAATAWKTKTVMDSKCSKLVLAIQNEVVRPLPQTVVKGTGISSRVTEQKNSVIVDVQGLDVVQKKILGRRSAGLSDHLSE